MPQRLQMQIVDAFAERPFRGNRAGVVFDVDALSERQMQQIASEIGASETAFVSRANDLHRPTLLRWFTPEQEVSFCGHATLAAAHALHTAGRLGDLIMQPHAKLELECAAGMLTLEPETMPQPDERVVWWLHMPDPQLKPDNTNPMRTCELLGMHVDDLDPAIPPMRTRDNDLIYMVCDLQRVLTLQPRFDELGAWCTRVGLRGICVATTATLSDAVNVHSRFFAPAVGVDEDPVTGSVHGPLATLLVVNEQVGSAAGHASLMCAQGRPDGRTGLVRALVHRTPKGFATKIGGFCHTSIHGEVLVPPSN